MINNGILDNETKNKDPRLERKKRDNNFNEMIFDIKSSVYFLDKYKS
jgi:hypothetical protein